MNPSDVNVIFDIMIMIVHMFYFDFGMNVFVKERYLLNLLSIFKNTLNSFLILHRIRKEISILTLIISNSTIIYGISNLHNIVLQVRNMTQKYIKISTLWKDIQYLKRVHPEGREFTTQIHGYDRDSHVS